MTILDDIEALITAGTVHTGYAPSGAVVPYVVHRPLFTGDLGIAVNGDALAWDMQTTLYCCGASVEASFNLALAVMRDLQGKPAGGCSISTSMGYTGAQVEGHYESQVTVQLNLGGI